MPSTARIDCIGCTDWLESETLEDLHNILLIRELRRSQAVRNVSQVQGGERSAYRIETDELQQEKTSFFHNSLPEAQNRALGHLGIAGDKECSSSLRGRMLGLGARKP
ncbi:MAG: hypothetical protein ACI97A_001499 [Planctomycetota bacterium]|jgi:hypothetical protein